MTQPAIPPLVVDAAAKLWRNAGRGELQAIVPLPGGRNNRVYRVTSSSASGVLKHYHQFSATGHDRFATELAWYQFCARERIGQVAELWGADPAARCALFSEIPGRKLLPGEVAADHVQQAAEFISAVNECRSGASAQDVPVAADACFSIRDHCLRIEKRLERLRQLPAEDAISRELREWLAGPVAAVWTDVQTKISTSHSPEEVSAVLPLSGRCLSPSDFGFHNTLLDAHGRLWFVDFEYAGWDDPAKMACDFYWQVDVPAPRETLPILLEALIPWGTDVPRRVQTLFPLYGVKWCTIVLNEFLNDGSVRRQFAAGDQPQTDRRPHQLRLAQQILADVRHQLSIG